MGSKPTPLAPRRSITPLIVGALVIVALIAGGIYLSRPVPEPGGNVEASPEAKAYVPNLQLSGVNMKATENFMQQQVVEVTGKITNNGSRPLAAVELFCLFRAVDGHEIHREKVPIVRAGTAALGPGQTRAFRLPFDNLPDGWNQAMPAMFIARIVFEQ
jgi:hypothetical protein